MQAAGGHHRLHRRRIALVFPQAPDAQRQSQPGSNPGGIFKALFRGNPTSPAEGRITSGDKLVAIQIEAIAHQLGRSCQGEIGGLAGGMKGEPCWLPAADRLNRLVHGRTQRTHAHQMADGGVNKGRQPEGEPVVGEVEDQVEIALPLQGPLPQPRQQAVGGNFDWHLPGPMLPAGLGRPGLSPKGGGSAGLGQTGALPSQHRDAMAAAQQPGDDHRPGVLDAAAATTAKHPDRCTDHQHPHPDGAPACLAQTPACQPVTLIGIGTLRHE